MSSSFGAPEQVILDNSPLISTLESVHHPGYSKVNTGEDIISDHVKAQMTSISESITIDNFRAECGEEDDQAESARSESPRKPHQEKTTSAIITSASTRAT